MSEVLLKDERPTRGTPSGSSPADSLETPCFKCGRANSPARTFCSGCGQRLWELCPECSGRHIPGEKYCGGCGLDLEKYFHEHRAQCECRLQEAIQLRERHEFPTAEVRLKQVAAERDERLQALVRQAAGLLQEIEADKKRWRKSTHEIQGQAEQHLIAYRYEEAAAALDTVPEPLRSERVAELLAEARGKRDEVAGLTAAIREAVAANQLEELPPKLDRLLELQPGHATAQRLARQLRDRIVAAAKKRLAADEFGAARRLLDKIPEAAQDEEVETLRDHSRELEWLLQALKSAPVVDRPLLALAERLVKLRPEHAEAAQLLKRIRLKLREPPTDRRHAWPAWVVKSGRFSFPVSCLAGLQQIACSPDLDALVRQTPGRWFVACGLALQALEHAAVPINLLPAKDGGLLTKLPFLRRKSAAAAWGLDLGASGLKAVRLTLEPSRGTVALEAVELVDFPAQVSQATDEAEWRRTQLQILQQFVQRHELGGERIGLSVSSRQVLGRFCELPPLEPKRLPDVIRYEAGMQYPFDLQELVWGYHILPRPEGDGASAGPMRVVMQAVKRHHVHELLSLCQDAGLNVDVLQSDSLALHNFAVHEFFSGAEANDPNPAVVALLDLGAQSANLVLSSPRFVWFRNIAVAGEMFTSTVLRPLKLTREQAEQLKREPAKAHRVYRLYELWEPILGYLADEIDRSLATCKRQTPGLKLQQLGGLGGGFQLHGVLRRLAGA